MPKNYYEVLGVAQTATPQELKSAFRALVLKYHPDKNPNNPAAAEKLKEVLEAYNALTSEPREDLSSVDAILRSFFNFDIVVVAGTVKSKPMARATCNCCYDGFLFQGLFKVQCQCKCHRNSL